MRQLSNYPKQINLIILVLFFLICMPSKGQDPINILIVSSYNKNIPTSVSLERGLSKEFEKIERETNIFYEHMDADRLKIESDDFYNNYLKEKYSKVKFDYIICWGFNAIELLTSHRDIFPNSKRVLIEGTKDISKEDFFLGDDLIIKTTLGLHSSIEEIFRIKETKKIIVIGNKDEKGEDREG